MNLYEMLVVVLGTAVPMLGAVAVSLLAVYGGRTEYEA